MKKIIVLGAGMVGKAMAIDLCKKYKVTSADISDSALEKLNGDLPLETIKADLSNHDELLEIVKDHDLVIGAVPGFMGFETVKAVIEAGKDMVDISFFGEDPFELDRLAKEKNVTIVIDAGVAPGMDNIILGYHNTKMEVSSFECLVGGLPVNKEWPYNYKAPFSPIDVLEEYTRPARIVRDSKEIVVEALSDPEEVAFDKIGVLESFNTDGLRTLIKTMDIPNMIEKTLRYPGHIEYIRVLRETGFFEKDPILIDEKKIRPIDLTTKLLFPMWKLKEEEEEFTVMRVTINGIEDGKTKKYIYDLFDKFDTQTKTSSMARTTGYTCTAIANLILDGHFTQKGICPPEYVGAAGNCFDMINEYFMARYLVYTKLEYCE